MKKNLLSKILLLTAILFVASCTSKKQDDGLSASKKPEMTFEHSDTVAVTALIDDFVSCMADNRFEDSANMLYKVESEDIRPLDDNELKTFQKFWSNFKIYAAKSNSFVMRSGRNNDVTVMLQITESGDIDQEIGVTSIHLNPVYQDGRWYLTLLDKKANGVYDVYNEEEQPTNVGVVAN